MPRRHVPGFTYIQVMNSSHHYGGPEEGGWYYTSIRNIIPIHKVPTGSAMNLAKKLKKRHGGRIHIQHKSEWSRSRLGWPIEETFIWVGKAKHSERNASGRCYE